jgi:uncharacterized protein GlcG (DUF336 family)
MQLSSHQAQTIIDGAEAKARKMGLAVVIAVLDAGAHLKAFRRMGGAVLASNDIAIRKASTAVLFQANSEAVWEYCKPGAPAPGLEQTNGGLAPFGGGIPLKGQDGIPTGVLAEAYQTGTLMDQRAAVVLYASVAGLMSAAWLPVFPYLARHPELLETEGTATYFAKQWSRPVVGVVAYVVAAAAGWLLHPAVAIAVFAFMVIYHAWTSRGLGGRQA